MLHLLYLLHNMNNRSEIRQNCLSSVQFSHSVMSDSLRPRESQHARPPCPSPSPGVHPDSRPSSPWCHPAISSYVILFSSCLQSFPESGYFPMSQFFASDGQTIQVSASTSVLLMNIQDWFPLGCTSWTSLQSRGLSKVMLKILHTRLQQYMTPTLHKSEKIF